MQQIFGIIIFCASIEFHEKWASKISLVKKVVNTYPKMFAKLKELVGEAKS